MADSNFRGPVNSMGPLEGDSGGTATIGPLDGPSMAYQGYAVPDIRSFPFAKDGFRPGQQPAFMFNCDVVSCDNIPQAATTTLLGAAQLVTGGTALTLATAQVNGPAPTSSNFAVANIACGVPILPQGTTTLTTVLWALDFGFATGTTASASSTVITNDNSLFTVGQWIIIGGAGNSAGTQSLVTQVTAISTTNTTGINVGPSLPAATFSNAPIGGANLFGGQFLPPASQFGPALTTANAASPNLVAGLARIHNPKEMLARCIGVNFGTTTSTATVTITGYDVWRQPMTETITIPSGNRSLASSFFGAKAFKYVSNIAVTTQAAGSTGTASVGIGDVFGYPFRADYWEQTEVWWNGCTAQSTQVGFTKAGTTSPATATTGDVRGTIQVSTLGTGSAAVVATASVSNGTGRLVMIQNLGTWNWLYGTPINTVPMFGVANSTS